MNSTALKSISVFGQFLAVFPFVVLYEGVGFGKFIWWHYPVLFAVYAVFYFCGRICSNWALSPKRNRYFRPKAIFLSKSAIIVPAAVLIVVCAVFELSGAIYLYALPAALIMYHGGYSTSGKDYSNIFTRGWFALFFVAAVVSSILLWFTRRDEMISAGNFQLCLAFGLLIIIAAVLTNQTNIDLCTHQRDAERSSLPKGLRAYNSGLVAAVVAVIVGLCLFAAPFAQGLIYLIKTIIRWIASVIRGNGYDGPVNDVIFDLDGSSDIAVDINDNSVANVLSVLVFVALVVLVIIFRRQIWSFIKGLAAPLFRVNEYETDPAYFDEVTELSGLMKGSRSRRKTLQIMYRNFRKETDAILKYRIGYNLMLLYLTDTPFAPIATDNTDIHRVKGEQGFRSEKVQDIVSVYNAVRYSGRVPTAEELSFEESFIEEIRR